MPRINCLSSSFYILDVIRSASQPSMLSLPRLLFAKYSPLLPLKSFRLLTTPSVHVEFKDGLANITVPLPSRSESCVFQVSILFYSDQFDLVPIS